MVLKQDGLTDYANIALSIPSANTNIWDLEQDALANRPDNGRQAQNGVDTGALGSPTLAAISMLTLIR